MTNILPLIKGTAFPDLYIQLFKRKRFDFITVRQDKKHLKQEEALFVLTDAVTTELGYGGAAGGAKSWTGCEWLFWSCLAYPDTKWFIGRQELKRIIESTLITFYKVVKKYNLNRDDYFKFDGKYNHIVFHNGSRIDLLDLRLLPSDPLYERYGSLEYTGGWIEEGGEVNFGAYDTLKSRIGRHNNDKYGLKRKLLVTLNPKKNWAYKTFYKPGKASPSELPDYRQFLQALVYDNPFRESDYVEALQSLTDKAKKERLLKGNWEYDDDPAALIEYDSILNLFTNQHIPRTGVKYISCDVARKGKDSIKICVWDDWTVIEYNTYKGLLVTETAKKIREAMNRHSVPASRVIVDEDGVGGGVVDIVGCYGFVNGSRPMKERFPKAGRMVPNYDNLKSQCYFKLADRINDAGMCIASGVMTAAEVEQLTEELEQVKQKDVDSDGKLGVVPKEDVVEILGRSPDNSDVLMMRQYFELEAPRRSFSGADNS